MSKQLTVEEIDIKTVTPDTYCAVLHNDDTTSIDFVVHVLNTVYRKSIMEAVQLATEAHTQNTAVIARGTKNYLGALSSRALGMANQYGYEHFTITNEPEE